mmetsp:Transcript_67652/g.180043  ORF Transcript_67652/g.180043 Transcript_67652/m.180043 type:complete len:210 (-) Transcript_67652:16-645(-)
MSGGAGGTNRYRTSMPSRSSSNKAWPAETSTPCELRTCSAARHACPLSKTCMRLEGREQKRDMRQSPSATNGTAVQWGAFRPSQLTHVPWVSCTATPCLGKSNHHTRNSLACPWRANHRAYERHPSLSWCSAFPKSQDMSQQRGYAFASPCCRDRQSSPWRCSTLLKPHPTPRELLHEEPPPCSSCPTQSLPSPSPLLAAQRGPPAHPA